MTRTLLNACATALAAVGVALVPLWWRSPQRSDWVAFVWPAGDVLRLRTHPHGLTLGWSDVGRTQALTPWPYGLLHAGLNRGSVAYGPVVINDPPVTTRTPTTGPDGRASQGISVSSTTTKGTFAPLPIAHSFGGFGADWVTLHVPMSTAPAGAVSTVTYRLRSVEAPFWALLAVCTSPGAARVWRHQRARRRYAVGHCQHCGYDLRGSPGRCPECGAVPA